MTKKFQVQVDERFTHTMFIEAESEDDATEKAYELLRDGIRYNKELQEEFEYNFDTSGFDCDYTMEWDV